MFKQATLKQIIPTGFRLTPENFIFRRGWFRSYETGANFKPTLKFLLPQEQIIYPKMETISRKPEDTLFSNTGDHLLEINAQIRKQDRKMRLFNSKLTERRIYKLFECAKLPPIPKRPKSNAQVSYQMLIKDAKQLSEFYKKLILSIKKSYRKYLNNEPEKLESKCNIMALYEKLETECGNLTEFPLLISRFVMQLLQDKQGDLALSIFQKYTESINLQSTKLEEDHVEQVAMVSVKMAQALGIHFSKDSNATRITKVYDLFQGLGLDNGGRMEYLVAVAHAKEGKFYAAQLLLVLAIVEFKYTPHPKDLNILLELAVNDLPSGRSFADALNQYMEHKYPPSHVPRPSLNAKTFALKAQLCSTAQELTELIGRADQYRLLTSHLLQEAVIKKGVHLLKDDLPQNTHLLHGWLTRLHRPQRKYKATGLVPQYHEVSSNTEITCVYVFCQAKCAISATNILTSLLKNHPSINPAKKSKLFRAVLKTIVQYPHTHNLGWKNAILSWLTLHLQPQGEWNVDPSLRHLVFQALISLNEPEMGNTFRESFASDSFPTDISSYISILEDGLTSTTKADSSSRA